MSIKCPKCNSPCRRVFSEDYDLECTSCGAKCLIGASKTVKREFNPYGEDADQVIQRIKEQIAKNKKLQEAKLNGVDGRVHLFCPIEEMAKARKWFEDHGVDPNDIVFKDETDIGNHTRDTRR